MNNSIHPRSYRRDKISQREYIRKYMPKYRKKYLIRYYLTLNKTSEKEIVQWLEKNRPYQTALKRLILAEIEKEKEERKAKRKTQNKAL